MLHGVVALLSRSLKLEANWLRTHMFRLGFMVVIYCQMLMAQVQSLTLGAPGLSFFGGMLFLNTLFITLGGISFFATAITEEKEEDTIGLLLMAGINPLSLLFGKSTSRLLQALLLVVVQIPFTLLAITLGGVLLNQVIAAYASLLAYTLLFANVGLLASVVSRRSGTAMAWSVGFLVIYTLAPLMVSAGTNALQASGRLNGTIEGTLLQSLSWVSESSIWGRMAQITTTGFADQPLGTQVISNSLGAVVCFLLAWGLFGWFALADVPAVASRGLLMRRRGRWRWMAAGRAWPQSLVWKDYNFITGGNAALVLKLVGYGLLLPLLAIGLRLIDERSNQDLESIVTAHLMLMAGLLLLESASFASRLFHDEIRGQTMVSLLTLPRSIQYVTYGKTAGCLLGLAPVLLWLLIDITLLPEGWHNAIEMVTHPGFWTGALVASVFLHLTVLLSLFVKWGAMPLAFFLTLVTNYCCPVLWLPLIFFGMQDDDLTRLIFLGILGVMHIMTAFVFQMMIHARLYELGIK